MSSISIIPKYYSHKDIYIATNSEKCITNKEGTVHLDGLVVPMNNISDLVCLKITWGSIHLTTIPFTIIIATSKITLIDDMCHIHFSPTLLSDKNIEFPCYMDYCGQLTIMLISNYCVCCSLLVTMKHYESTYLSLFKPFSCNIKNYITQSISQYNKKVYYSYGKNWNSGVFIQTAAPLKEVTIDWDNISQTFNKVIIGFYKCLIQKKSLWSKRHILTTQFILEKVIPGDIVSEILKLCVSDQFEYMYWFPINPIQKVSKIYIAYRYDTDQQNSKIDDHAFIPIIRTFTVKDNVPNIED